MKKLIFIILIVLIGIGSTVFYFSVLKEKQLCFNLHQKGKTGKVFDQWAYFKHQENLFSATFPLLPQPLKRTLPVPGNDADLPYHEYQCLVEENKLYSISYTILPDTWLKWGNSLVLKGALKVILKELGKVNLVGKDSNTFKSFPALDYEHYSGEKETVGTLILIENRLYKVEVTYPLNERQQVQEKICYFIEQFTPNITEPTSSSQKTH